LQASPLPSVPKDKFLMEQRKRCLSSPSLQDSSPAACHPVDAASRGSLAHSRGAPIDTLASRRCSPPPTHVAHVPDCPGSRHHPAAWPAASVAAGHADTLSFRNTLDREPVGVAETPRRTRHIAAPPSTRPPPRHLSRVRYRPAVNGLVTNSRAAEKHRWQSIQFRVSLPMSTAWVNSNERQHRARTDHVDGSRLGRADNKVTTTKNA